MRVIPRHANCTSVTLNPFQSMPATPAKNDKDISIPDALQAAFDSTDAVRFFVTSDGKILHFNRKAYENSILLHNKEIKRGDNLYDFAADTENLIENKLKKDLALAFKGENFQRETHVKFTNGEKWFETEYSPIIFKKKIVAVSISTVDITHRKTRELDLRNALDEIKSTRVNRIVQFEFMISNIFSHIHAIENEMKKRTGSGAEMISSFDKLKKELLRLTEKLAVWKKNT
jgi:PAS domain S-box-containing protein